MCGGGGWAFGFLEADHLAEAAGYGQEGLGLGGELFGGGWSFFGGGGGALGALLDALHGLSDLGDASTLFGAGVRSGF